MKFDHRKTATGGMVLVASLLLALLVAACGGSGGTATESSNSSLSTTTSSPESSSPESSKPASSETGEESENSESWSNSNYGLGNVRAVKSEISSENVAELKPAWEVTFPVVSKEGSFNAAGQFSDFASTPIIGPEGIVYLQDIGANVFAVEEETGKYLWRHEFDEPSEGPNGVTLEQGVIYGTTPRYAFALDAKTGDLLWKSARLVQTFRESKEAESTFEPGNTATLKGVREEGQGINIAPQVDEGRVYVATSGQSTGGKAYALDAKTGKVLWTFEEVKENSERGLGGAVGSGGSWNSAAVSPDGKTVYFGIANPYQAVEAAYKHPHRLLYNDSTVALDSETGKLKWYMQGVPNDSFDWDMQLSPIYAEGASKEGKDLVLDGGKMGYVYGMDAESGKLLWKTPVGKHNGYDNVGKEELEHKFKPPTGAFYTLPGSLGGIETNMAYSENVVYTAGVNMGTADEFGTTFGEPPREEIKVPAPNGYMAAVDTETGEKLWETELPALALGAATVTNDLVFTTIVGGKVIGFNKETGKIVWEQQLPTGTNSPIVIEGNTLIAVAGQPEGEVEPTVVAYRLGVTGAPIKGAIAPANGAAEAEAGGEEVTVSAAAGKEVFTTTCGTCHTLAAAGTGGKVGPNLDQLKPSDSLVEHQVTNGGGGMPAFGGQLSKTEIESVAKYVSSVAGKPLTAKQEKEIEEEGPTAAAP
jgi:glucose dehydrogenase/mono/diheme cytochrome c family protein